MTANGSSSKVKRSEVLIKAYHNEIDTRKAENYGFASMTAMPLAHIIARLLREKKPHGAIVMLVPSIEDIVSYLSNDIVFA